jgi:hypothetical protein
MKPQKQEKHISSKVLYVILFVAIGIIVLSLVVALGYYVVGAWRAAGALR